MKNIKWIFFDFGSTIINEERAYDSSFRTMAEEANTTYENVLEKVISFYKKNMKGVSEASKYFKIEKPKWDSRLEYVYDGVFNVLRTLSQKYSLGIIANQECDLKRKIDEFNLYKYFQVVVSSSDIGIEKPNPKIFEIALENAGCNPDEALMVGDRIDNDIIPAKKVGMSTVWVRQGFSKYYQIEKEEDKPDYTIDSIADLLNISYFTIKKLREELFELKDEKYKKFNSSLIPNEDKSFFIGVRNPDCREMALNLSSIEKENILNTLPHQYYEEFMIHRYIIEKIKDYDKMVFELNKLVPYMSNWGMTDGFTNYVIKKHKKEFINVIYEWLKSDHIYTVRFGIDMLMAYYLDDDFDPKYLEIVSKIDSKDEYYLKMIIAWFFATALAKQYDSTIPYIQNKKLEKWVHNKAIQKAKESYRVSEEIKDYLVSLKY